MISYKLLVSFAFVLAMLTIFSVKAQPSPTPVQCGQIISSEFLRAEQEGEQEYTLNLAPGDALRVSGDTVGDYLKFVIGVLAPTTGWVAHQASYFADEPSVETDVLSERGIYTIRVRSNGPGLYTLYIGCTLGDGTEINPGDLPPDAQPTQQPAPAQLPANFVGFPGLPPVDFSNVAKLPLPAGIAMSGGITPTGGEILGYMLDANAGDVVDLTVNRVTGNLNLGLVVLSAENQVVFQASLVTSSTLNTRFTLPSAGQYTIGVFRIDLLPPSAPEATAFQITATLNPA